MPSTERATKFYQTAHSNQCYGSRLGSAMIFFSWIRIRIGNADVLKSGMFFFEGLEASPVAWMSFNRGLSVYQDPDADLEPHRAKMLDPDPHGNQKLQHIDNL
jgi:hypothetical protein